MLKAILKNEGQDRDDNFRTYEAKVFETSALEAIRKLNINFFMDAEDTWFIRSSLMTAHSTVHES